MRVFLPLFLLSACAGGSGSSDVCRSTNDLDAGTAVATVDGTAWVTTADWLWQGESLQINAAPADGWSISFVGQLTAEGDSFKAAADAGALPITVPLDESSAWALVYPTDGDSYDSRNGAGGALTVTDVGDELLACFDFDAATDGGDTVSMSDGALRATLSPFAE